MLTIHKPNRKPKGSHSRSRSDEGIANVADEFRRAYADAINPASTEDEWAQVCRVRQLVWKGRDRISLRAAAALYGQIASYNAFRGLMIDALQRMFADDGITVTPAREYSPVIYLHVAGETGLHQRVESFVRANLDADEITWKSPETLRVWWD